MRLKYLAIHILNYVSVIGNPDNPKLSYVRELILKERNCKTLLLVTKLAEPSAPRFTEHDSVIYGIMLKEFKRYWWKLFRIRFGILAVGSSP